jgi:TPR repeat protein
MKWRVPPSYETQGRDNTQLVIPAKSGSQPILYDESHAVLIVEGAYKGGWTAVSDPAARSEALVKAKLESLGFHVLVWRDLSGDQLRVVLDEMLSNIGYRDEARLFFYYFGHGTVLGTPDDVGGIRTFLVPVDAQDPSKDLKAFQRAAVPISRLTQIAGEMTLKHAFFALEACRAGDLIATLSAPPPPNPTGYLLGDNVRRPVRQFLTAGGASEDVPANGLFTSLLVAGLSGESRNGDGYVYGSDVISYVSHELPRYAQGHALYPAAGWLPHANYGDMVMGPSLASQVHPMPAPRRSGPGPTEIEYSRCRRAENGIESWQHEAPWTAESGWLGSGNNERDVCNGLIAGFTAANAGHVVELRSTSEKSKPDLFGHVEYRYVCSGVERSEPIFKEAQSPSCGIARDDREAARVSRESNDQETVRLLKSAADHGDPKAQATLGEFYRDGRGGLPKDDREAVRLFRQAAEQNNPSGQANLARFYRDGRGGLATDEGEARRLFGLAAEQDDAVAQYNLGIFYRDGRGGLQRDDREAVRLFRLAADHGLAFAQVNMGRYYDDGRGGLPKDEREAMRYYSLAAAQGDAVAQNNIAVNYRDGLAGVQKDEQEAAKLFRLAADGGDANAQASLGQFYERGLGGLPKDELEAARLYKLAADQGNAYGISNLGRLCEFGRGGLSKDENEAVRLYQLAAAQGNEYARNALERLGKPDKAKP